MCKLAVLPLPALAFAGALFIACRDSSSVAGPGPQLDMEPAVTSPAIELLDLGLLPEWWQGAAHAINDAGKVAGFGGNQLFLWTNPLGFVAAEVRRHCWLELFGRMGVNNRGWVATSTDVSGFPFPHAVLWAENLGLLDAGTLPGHNSSHFHDVNATGLAVGFSDNLRTECYQTLQTRAIRWTEQEGMVELPKLPGGGPRSDAYAVNDRGDIVGWATSASGEHHAVLWPASGGVEDLGTLSGAPYSRAVAINNLRQVVGESGYRVSMAFLWTREEGMRPLGTLPGTLMGRPMSINERGQVVGWSSHGPTLWQDDELIPLGTLGGGNTRAFDINAHGQAVGESQATDGRYHPVLWTIRR